MEERGGGSYCAALAAVAVARDRPTTAVCAAFKAVKLVCDDA